MNAKRMGAVTLAVVLVLVVVTPWHRLFGQPTRQATVAGIDQQTDTPPGLKKGAKVWFSADKTPFASAGYAEGFLVEEIQGSWVRMKGESFEGAPWKEKETSAWINLRSVHWYKVKEQRPGREVWQEKLHPLQLPGGSYSVSASHAYHEEGILRRSRRHRRRRRLVGPINHIQYADFDVPSFEVVVEEEPWPPTGRVKTTAVPKKG